MSRVFRSATLYASTLALESRPLGAAAYTGPAGSRRWYPEAPGPSVGRGLTRIPLRADTQRSAVFGCGHQSVIPTLENFVLASAQMNPEELASECRGREHGGTDPVALRKKRVCPIEDIGRLSLAKPRLIAYIERGHDGGLNAAGRNCPVPASPRRSAAVNDRRPRPRGARLLRVIDGENGVISSRAPQARPFRHTSCTSSNDSNAVTSDSSRAAWC
jgi:hypothetical protein